MHKFIYLLLVLLLSLNAAYPQGNESSGLEPYRVAKTGDVDVPEGMEIKLSNTGERWIVPIGGEIPEKNEIIIKYYKNKQGDPTIKGNIEGQKVLSHAKSAEATVLTNSDEFWNKLPNKFRDLMFKEKDLNIHAQTSTDLLSLGEFGAHSKSAFELPYIPIPEEEMRFSHLSGYAAEETKNLVRFQKDGKTWVRFFIHPNYPDRYDELIKKYGIVYHYQAVTSSSPRSLIVIDPSNPAKVHWVKVSLHKKIDGSVRINHEKKLRRAVINSEAIAHVPADNMKNYKLRFMLEPASMQPPGKITGTIFRELHPEMLNPRAGHTWLPAFALNAKNDGGETVLIEMIKKSGKSPKAFVTEDIVRPLLFSYLNMGIKEGLPGELHTQNFYFELNRNGLPTGQLLFKDNDGFRFDVEIAMRNERNMNYLAQFDTPFQWAKYSNALGTGGEKVPFLGSWYYKLIRNVNGFETLSSYILSVSDQFGEIGVADGFVWNKDNIQRLFDDIALEEATKITGVTIPDDMRYGFGSDKGLNEILHRYRAKLANSVDVNARHFQEQIASDDLQKLLEKEFDRLKGEQRAHMRGGKTRSSYFLYHKMDDGTIMIELQQSGPRNKYKNQTIGIAMMNAQETEAFNDFLEQFKQDFPTGFCSDNLVP